VQVIREENHCHEIEGIGTPAFFDRGVKDPARRLSAEDRLTVLGDDRKEVRPACDVPPSVIRHGSRVHNASKRDNRKRA
jgi:hypothetical protein